MQHRNNPNYPPRAEWNIPHRWISIESGRSSDSSISRLMVRLRRALENRPSFDGCCTFRLYNAIKSNHIQSNPLCLPEYLLLFLHSTWFHLNIHTIRRYHILKQFFYRNLIPPIYISIRHHIQDNLFSE